MRGTIILQLLQSSKLKKYSSTEIFTSAYVRKDVPNVLVLWPLRYDYGMLKDM